MHIKMRLFFLSRSGLSNGFLALGGSNSEVS